MSETNPQPRPQHFVVIHKDDRVKSSPALTRLDTLEKYSKIISLFLVPIVIAIVGWRIEVSINNRSLSRDFVQIAVNILVSPEGTVKPPITEWAVDLLVDHSPTELSEEAINELKGGAPLYTISFSVPVEKIVYLDYTVQEGDTLYSISERIDTSVSLMAEKGITQSNLTPGQVIKLPVGNPAYCTGKGRPYAVEEGDSAFTISQKFNVTATDLQLLNGLDANYIVKIADIICVP